MNIDNTTIVTGAIFVIVTLLIRLFTLKKRFIEKVNLVTSLGYCIFSYTSAIVIVKMINLATLTYTDKLTLELISQNKVYIFFAWGIIGLSAIVAYISLLIEQHKNK